MRFAALLSSPGLSLEQRWRLVSSLYDQTRTLIEGSISLLVTLAICAYYTGWRGFWMLAGLTTGVTLIRLLHLRRFVRARTASSARSPEAWARDYTVGICAMSLLWGCAVNCVSLLFHDMLLLMFVLLIQNAWLAGAVVRNAASPSAILGQTVCVVLPAMFAAACSHSSLVRLLAPACFMFMAIIFRIGQFYGAQTLSLMESEQSLAAANEKLVKLSSTDGLTQIANRRAFDERLAADWSFAVRGAHDLALIMIDVDYFKAYNDHYGHLAGDDCLRAVARHVAGAVLRASDFPARYGGEEFVVLMPGNVDEGAKQVAERLRKLIFEASLTHEASPLGRVTVSVGVASMAPDWNDLPETLIKRADLALYAAKQGGRNQVCIAAPQLATLV